MRRNQDVPERGVREVKGWLLVVGYRLLVLGVDMPESS
jgi:hypothetical protein